MVNVYKIRKYAALLLVGLLTTIAFYLGIQLYKNLWLGLGFMAGGLLISLLIASALLSNPFSSMLEGAGVITFNIDSTGIIRPFIMRVLSPYVEGKLDHKLNSDVFDRSTVYQLSPPINAGYVQEGIGKDGVRRLAIVVDEDEYNRSRFQLMQYPTIIFNDQIKSIITKDFLSGMEKTLFAEHTILYLNRKMEELTSAIRDFGRYVVESLKPSAISGKTIAIAILVIGLIVLGALFLPQIIQTLQGEGGKAVQSAATSASGAIKTLN